jgi:hypothetical protein
MFCALVVLVLFVMALAIEVSDRVRAELAPTDPIEVVNEAELSQLTKAEVAELSRELQERQAETERLKSRLGQMVDDVEMQKRDVEAKVAALSGEQRFTGAREPASLNMAYDYKSRRFYFVPARDSTHATRRTSGETSFSFAIRNAKELVEIALNSRKQRGFTLDETIAIYSGFSQYKEVEPSTQSYSIVDSTVGITYNTALCGYIAGDQKISDYNANNAINKLLEVYGHKGPASDEMYPSCLFEVDVAGRTITLNGVQLSPRDAKEILLSFGGRGAMIDLEGFVGPAPDWLREQVLIPAGYISKTPKLPAP